MTRLIIIRHGLSVTNKAKVFTGQSDVPLAPEGEKQAETVCEYVYKNFKIDRIYSSDLQRAANTIKPLADKLMLEINALREIRELDVGIWQGRPIDEVKEEFQKELEAYRNDPANHGCVGGETYRDLYNRAVPALIKIAKENDGKTVAVATHGGVIRVATCFFRGLDVDEVKNITHCPNASLMVVSYENGKFRIETESHNSYLEDKITEKGLN